MGTKMTVRENLINLLSKKVSEDNVVGCGDIADFLMENGVVKPDGRWIESDDYIVCPECFNCWNICDNCTETFDYCPKCGADLREV